VRYAAALENPPLQVVCDTDRFIVRTAWTNAVPKQYEIELDDLALPEKREILWAVFHDPEKLRPKETRAGVTKEAADKFSSIASRLQGRGTPEEVAHFVNQLVFCFFANSVKLLPEGFFLKLLKRARQRPDKAQEYFNSLFEAMEHGGEFDLTDIAHFNGGLFDGRRAIQLDDGDIGLLVEAGNLDWSLIDPAIFGTLFERFLDPDKRAQIGALKGIAKVRAKGHTYWYAWRGGPRLSGEPGSPEFITTYNEAIEQRRTPDKNRFRFIVADYKASGEYQKLAESTRAQWGKWLDRIAEYFGELRIAQFDRPEKIRPVIRRWRNRWIDTPRTADYALQVLSRVVAHAVELGRIAGGGIRIFPVHGVRNGKCTCSRTDNICDAKPPAPGKHPRINAWSHNATNDVNQIRRWWQKWPDANIGFRVGS